MVVAVWEMRHNSIETSDNAGRMLGHIVVADLDVSSTLLVYS